MKPAQKRNKKNSKADITIPAAALSEAGFFEYGKAKMKIAENLIILTKPDMTPRELEDTAAALVCAASEFLTGYFLKTGEYPSGANCGNCNDFDGSDDNDDYFMDCDGECEKCDHSAIDDCGAAFQIPICILEEAGIDYGNGVMFSVGSGRIIISEPDGEVGEGNE